MRMTRDIPARTALASVGSIPSARSKAPQLARQQAGSNRRPSQAGVLQRVVRVPHGAAKPGVISEEASAEDPSSAPRPDDELLAPTDVALEDSPPPAAPGSAEALRRQAWARLIRKVFEVDPLVCPRCGVEMEVVAWITKPSVVDAILRHRREHGLVSPFEARAPPAA